MIKKGDLIIMNFRFEKKATFYVSGYPMETSEKTLEKDCAALIPTCNLSNT